MTTRVSKAKRSPHPGFTTQAEREQNAQLFEVSGELNCHRECNEGIAEAIRIGLVVWLGDCKISLTELGVAQAEAAGPLDGPRPPHH